MHKNKLILLLGLIVAVTPYSGFPWDVKRILIAGMGVSIAILAFLVERHIKISFHWPRKKSGTTVATTYVEHDGAQRHTIVNNSSLV